MATKTGSTYISESMIYISSKFNRKSAILTTTNSMKMSPSDCDNDGQPEMERLASITVYCHFRLLVIVAVAWGYFLWSCRGWWLHNCDNTRFGTIRLYDFTWAWNFASLKIMCLTTRQHLPVHRSTIWLLTRWDAVWQGYLCGLT